MSAIDYEAVLADLRDRRDKLNAAIAGIELVLGIAPVAGEGSAASAAPAPKPPESLPSKIESDTFFGMTAGDATRKYLRMVKRPASLTAILNAIQEGGYLTNAKNFYANLYTTLSRSDDFVKVGKNWGLVEWYPGRKLDQKTRSFAGSDGARNGGQEQVPLPRASFDPDKMVEPGPDEEGEPS